MSKKKIKFNHYRLALQWAILALLAYMVISIWTRPDYAADFEAFCPLGGLLAFSSFLANNSLACAMTSMQIVMGIALVAGILLFSKLFCGYLCPVGTITEWLGKLGEKFRIRITLTGAPDKILRILKYALLFITIYFTVTSSELFCKKFDPYYASFTGFSSDVNLWMAIAALVITVLGSIIIRQVWCKYLCPLGAISNIFTYFPVFFVVFGIYFILVMFKISIGWIYPLAAVTIITYLAEAFRLRDGIVFPLFRITRNSDNCSGCKLCDKACPQGILISEGSEKIRHIDCNLCCDCINVCQQKDILKINRWQIRWFPPVATLVLIGLGLYIGSTTELPTVDEKWGTPEQFDRAQIFERAGLKDIKCYGSSMGFVAQMHEVKGVIGVRTYVGTKSVKVYFDPQLTNTAAIVEAIFKPMKYILQKPDSTIAQLQTVTMHIEKFFDKYDGFYLTKIMEQQAGVYGFETQYGEPVIVRIYFDDKTTGPDKLKAAIESKSVTFEMRGEKMTEPINYVVQSVDNNLTAIDTYSFERKLFTPFYESFNNFERYDSTQVAAFAVPMPQAANPKLAKWLPYLESHLSFDTGVVALETKFTGDYPVALIYYLKTVTDTAKIFGTMKQDSLKVKYSDGSVEKVGNPFEF